MGIAVVVARHEEGQCCGLGKVMCRANYHCLDQAQLLWGTSQAPLYHVPQSLSADIKMLRPEADLSLSLSLQRRYSPGWASAPFKSFLHPSRFRATTFQFLHPSLATSSSTPSSQRSLGLPLGRFPPGPLRRTLLDRSSSSWRMTCPAHLSLLNLQNFTMSFSPHC